jgi:hypothetical protein
MPPPTVDVVGSGTDEATAGTITIPLTLAAGPKYVIVDLAVFVWSGGTIPAPTVGGAPMTLLAGGGTITQWLMLYRRFGLAVTGGAPVSVVVTHSGGSQQAVAIARAFHGVESLGPTEHSYVFTDTPAAGSLVHTTPEALVADAAFWRISNTMDPASGQTPDTGPVQNVQMYGRAAHKVGSGTVTMTWNAMYGGSPAVVDQLVLISTPLIAPAPVFQAAWAAGSNAMQGGRLA